MLHTSQAHSSHRFLDPLHGQIAFGHERRGTARRRPTVLVVDDQDAVRTFLALTLPPRGFQVLTAASGIEAVQICTIAPVDILLADVHMPGLSGVEAMARIRRVAPWIRCCLASGNTSLTGGTHLGSDAFIAKPFRMDELASVLWRLAQQPLAGVG